MQCTLASAHPRVCTYSSVKESYLVVDGLPVWVINVQLDVQQTTASHLKLHVQSLLSIHIFKEALGSLGNHLRILHLHMHIRMNNIVYIKCMRVCICAYVCS